MKSAAREVMDELAGAGAEAVVLTGSRARGEAGPESDVDILVVGPREFSFRLERRGGLLVSVSSRSFGAYRQAFGDPGSVCKAVPGWREALPFYDPEGLAAALIREARRWRWGPMEERCDRWVAEEVTSLAEEAHKLVAALRTGDRSGAAIQRSLLAVNLAPILAVRRRILYGSENRLWDLVSETMGEGWRRAQHAALGLDGEPFERACEAALRLYALAAEEVGDLLNGRQTGVVSYACRLSDGVF